MDQGRETLQRRSLAAFLSMADRRHVWSQHLVMLSATEEAAAFAMATLAAGGAVLWTCPDETSFRASGLDGLSDFQVNTLGEALRILKNEIRKGLPVSVAVLDADRTVWDEAITRGLQPDAVMADSEDAAAASVLVARGAEWLQPSPATEIVTLTAQSWRELRILDADLLKNLEACNEVQKRVAERWLRAAPRLFPRDLHRCYVAAWTASKHSR